MAGGKWALDQDTTPHLQAVADAFDRGFACSANAGANLLREPVDIKDFCRGKLLHAGFAHRWIARTENGYRGRPHVCVLRLNLQSGCRRFHPSHVTSPAKSASPSQPSRADIACTALTKGSGAEQRTICPRHLVLEFGPETLSQEAKHLFCYP